MNPIKYMLSTKTKILRVKRLAKNQQLRFAAPGHYYSPLPDLETLDYSSIKYEECAGINLREYDQCRFLQTVRKYYGDLPFSDTPEGTRFYYKNRFFGHSDAIILYTMMRSERPTRVIEIGSGFSSAVMLDTKERFLSDVHLTFVEPYPERLRSLLRAGEASEILKQPVQDVPLSVFRELGANDILFVDSSHVSKAGSDVNDIFFRILPALQAGVVIHFHDVLWPFEYLKDWLMKGRAWNEAYLLRAFLQYNDSYEIIYFNDFMAHRHADLLEANAPLMLEETGGSLWLRKKK